jgi:hypothetical protein
MGKSRNHLFARSNVDIDLINQTPASNQFEYLNRKEGYTEGGAIGLN